MGREPRIHYRGAWYHCIVRGNNRRALFAHSRDREHFASLLAQGVERFAHRIHAFAFMSNHVHLLVEVADTRLSSITHNLCSRYARWFNSRHARSGHLFERRYRAGLLRSDSSVLRVMRYIHLNPVRAGLVGNPARHPWCSHGGYLGLTHHDWLTTHQLLSLFDQDLRNARRGLDQFVRADSETDEPESKVEGLEPYADGGPADSATGRIVFSPNRVEPASPDASLEEILATVSAVTKVSPSEVRSTSRQRFLSRARALAAVLVRETDGLTLTRLSRELGRDASTLCRAAIRLTARARTDDRSAELIRQCRVRLAGDRESET